MGIYGIDVSSYQAEHFPTEVKGHAVDFAIIKATEGTGYVNPHQAGQAAWARSHGHVVGFYHFVRPGDMKAQAAYFAQKCLSQEGDILALDWEDAGVSGAQKDTFLKELKRLRPTHKVILYTYQNFWFTKDKTSFVQDGLWIANYTGTPGKTGIQAKWLIHQYTSTPVDTNYSSTWSSRAAMKAWAASEKVTTQPATPTKPPTKPVCDLSNVVNAAHSDPKAKQGHTTHAADVKLVEGALKAEKLLASTYAADGSYGTTTLAAYAKWQRKLGYSGKNADGIPGSASLKALAAKHGFTVRA